MAGKKVVQLGPKLQTEVLHSQKRRQAIENTEQIQVDAVIHRPY
jgi:hypothetical protein